MKNPFEQGSTKQFVTTVTPDKTAAFDSGEVHPLYSTFALGRDAEWACRLFVLDMKEDFEEGIGTFLSVHHLAPAPVNAEILFIATLEYVKGNTVHCSWEALHGQRKIAKGEQTQKILPKETLENIIRSL
jgi:predicted thioesterase